MKRIIAAAILTTMSAAPVLAQSCDTLGGPLNCGAGRAGSSAAPSLERKARPEAPRTTIGQDPETYKIIENDTSTDPSGRPKATLGGTTFYSDGKQCTRVGLTVNCR